MYREPVRFSRCSVECPGGATPGEGPYLSRAPGPGAHAVPLQGITFYTLFLSNVKFSGIGMRRGYRDRGQPTTIFLPLACASAIASRTRSCHGYSSYGGVISALTNSSGDIHAPPLDGHKATTKKMMMASRSKRSSDLAFIATSSS